ncbi:YtxH domain-containing protein [Bacillus coahuilensis]|nr:YtxH domain-containing protein [Bacillus coahuilensis]
MNNKKSFFMGLVTGSIAAAAYTFLHAPNSGKVTRKQLEEKRIH